MKNCKLFTGLILITLSSLAVSCSKNYTCSCVSTYADGGGMTTDETVTFTSKNISDANGNCSNMNEEYNGINTSYSRSCTAKLK